MNFQEAIASLGRPKTLGEAIAAIRAERGDTAADTAAASIPGDVGTALDAIRADHGPRATRWLADRLGVSLRQAQRYMRGEGLSTRTGRSRARRGELVEAAAGPRRAAVLRQASRRWVAAALLRRATRVNVGRVQVWDKSKNRPAGTRDVGTHRVTRVLRAQLAAAAQLLEDGDEQGALHAFSDALLDAYSASKGDPPGTASGPLYIYGYPSGIQVET